jgi:type IV pilus assembly protein PilY1
VICDLVKHQTHFTKKPTFTFLFFLKSLFFIYKGETIMNRFYILITSINLTLLMGLALPGFADDTDIYVRQAEALTQTTRPNVLFMLDNSGSMKNTIFEEKNGEGVPTGDRRIDVLKEALLQVLDEVHNVNVGLGRFASLIDKNEPPVNVPILFPIANIDGRAGEIEGEEDDSIMDTSVSIMRSEDDAEQNAGTGQMLLTDPQLQLTKISSSEEPIGVKVEKAIDEAGDDAVEWLGYKSGQLFAADPTLYLGSDPEQRRGDALIGLRFYGMGVPPGATIEYAEVEFVSDQAYESELQIEIRGAARDGGEADPAGHSFGDRDFEYGNSDNGYLSGEGYPTDQKNFPSTENVIPWVPESVMEGQVFKTANIAPIIQEIIERDGWQRDNGLVLLFQKTGSAEGIRGFYTANSANPPPTLRIYWSLQDQKITSISGLEADSSLEDPSFDHQDMAKQTSTKGVNNDEIRLGKDRKEWGETTVGIRFEALPIPREAKIQEARIIFTHQSGSEQDKGGSQNLNLKVYGEKIGDADKLGTNQTSYDPPLLRYNTRRTDEFVEWNNVGKEFANGEDKSNDAEIGEQFRTPDLKNILQEIIEQQEWQIGNNIVFLFKRNGYPTASNDGFRRVVAVRDWKEDENGNDVFDDNASIKPTVDTLPQLEVTFSAGLPDESEEKNPDEDKQLIGLRFVNVDIPQGAKVVKASIDLVSGADISEPGKLIIQAQDVDAAQSFTDEENNIASRDLTDAKVTWSLDSWRNGVTYTSPDISGLIQAVVNRNGWCGGRGGIAFIISEEGEPPFRIAKAYDDRPADAAVLNVEFDSKQISGNGCVDQNFSGQISAESDDAEEKLSAGVETGEVYLASSNLEMGIRSSEERLVGFRFREIPVSKQAKVKSASLLFTAREDSRNDNAKLIIEGEKSPNARTFSNNNNDLSGRPKTKSVEWPISEPWEKNKLYQSADITSIIQEIISQDDWETYNNMALFVRGRTGRRDVSPYNVGPASAAILKIQVEGYLGESGEGDLMTVRRRLQKIVKKLDIPASKTPIVDALYESAVYFSGKDVDYGKTRHHLSDYLVSHPGTYEGGNLKTPEDCKVYINPYDKNCKDEEITGSAKYLSPIQSSCQTNHLILLTDGLATRHTSVDKVQWLMKKNDCEDNYPDPESETEGEMVKVGRNEECGIDLTEYLRTHDVLTSKEAETNNIITHTIGFQLGKAWRRKYAAEGRQVIENDGIYYYRDNGEIVPGNVEIKPDGYEENPSGTEQNAEAVKFLKELAKRGGGIFYQADSVEDLVNAFKSVVADALTTSTSFAAPSVSVSRFNNLFHNQEVYYALFKPDQKQRWHGNVKKYKFSPEKGLRDQHDQTAVADSYINPDSTSFWSKPHSKDGGNVIKGGAGENIPSASSRHIYTYLTNPNKGRDEPSPGDNHEIDLSSYKFDNEEWRDELKKALFGDDAASEETVDKVIRWIRGEDVMGENGENSTGDRWKMADPLHSSPGSITYGNNSRDEAVTKLFLGTNDGLIRMIDGETGREDWAYLPADLLSIQKELMENETGERIYGVDGTPTFWLRDTDKNVEIDPEKKDFVKMFIGMRRGGPNIYALDVTGPATGEDNWGQSPKLMWVIKGGIEPFTKLGQTWSTPKPAKVATSYCKNIYEPDETSCTVLLFGGGYHTSHDEGGFSVTDTQVGGGNAIYMVHANTGELLWWASSERSEANLKLENMLYPIPSDLALKDNDGDGVQDVIYVGDIAGQVWRIALNGPDNSTGGRLASVSDTTFTARRRFFYPPETTVLKDMTIITIVSGSRPDPLDRKVRNRFYVFIETWKTGPNGEAVLHTIKENEMADVTEDAKNADQGDGEGEDGEETVYLDPTGDYPGGWYFNLQEEAGDNSSDSWIGEKGLAKPLILKEKVIFTTYVPPKQVGEDICSFDEGVSRLYGFNLYNGGPAFDKLSAEIRSGITSDAGVMVSEQGTIHLITNDPRTPSDNPLADGNSSSNSNCNLPGAIDCTLPTATFWRQIQ